MSEKRSVNIPQYRLLKTLQQGSETNLHPRRSSHPWRSTHPWRSSHSRRSSHTRRHAWGSKGRHSHGRAHARRHPHRTTWWHAHWPSHRWSHGPHTRRSPHAHGRWYSIAGVLSQLATHERSSSGIDQGLGLNFVQTWSKTNRNGANLIFHPLLVIELNILFVLSARAVSLSHTVEKQLVDLFSNYF